MDQPYVTSDSIEQKRELWPERIAPFNQHEMRLNKVSASLLVIDMQHSFLDTASPTFACRSLAILPGVKRLMRAFREVGPPVIHSRRVHHPDGFDAGIIGWWGDMSGRKTEERNT